MREPYCYQMSSKDYTSSSTLCLAIGTPTGTQLMYTHAVITVSTAEQDRKKYVLKLEKNLFWIKTGRRVWHLI